MLAKDRSFAPRRRVGPNRAPDAQPRSRDLLRRLGIHVADDVWHASRARRWLGSCAGGTATQRSTGALQSTAVPRSGCCRRIVPSRRVDSVRTARPTRSCAPAICCVASANTSLTKSGTRVLQGGSGCRDLGDRDIHARAAGDVVSRPWRLRDDAASRVSSRWDAAHAAEDEARRANVERASLSSSIAGTLHRTSSPPGSVGAHVRVPDRSSSRRAVSVPSKGHRRCRPATAAPGPDSVAGRPGAAASSADPAQRRRRPAAAGQAVADAAERVARVGWEAGRVW